MKTKNNATQTEIKHVPVLSMAQLAKLSKEEIRKLTNPKKKSTINTDSEKNRTCIEDNARVNPAPMNPQAHPIAPGTSASVRNETPKLMDRPEDAPIKPDEPLAPTYFWTNSKGTFIAPAPEVEFPFSSLVTFLNTGLALFSIF